MPRHGVTYEDVEVAIETLTKASLTPSIRLIREKVGRGSLSTIAEHKRAFDAKQADGTGPALPDRVTQSLLDGAKHFWRELVDAAEDQIQAIQAKANDQTKGLQRELEETQDALVSTRDTVGELRSTLSERDAQLAEDRAALADGNQRLAELGIQVSRLEAERNAFSEQQAFLQAELESTRNALMSSQTEAAQFSERLERQALESAKDKIALQKHFNEYKDRLVTMSDERRQALDAQRVAEKQATATEKQAAETVRESERLNRELTDARDEVRFLTETLGEVKGELSAFKARSADDLTNGDAKLKALQVEVETLQSQIREYASTDRSLVQALIDERQSASA